MGMLEIYEITFDVCYFREALTLNDLMIENYWDENIGGLYFSAEDGENLLLRQKEVYDGAIPSGNSTAILNLLRLSRITANPNFEEKAARIGHAFSGEIMQQPSAYA